MFSQEHLGWFLCLPWQGTSTRDGNSHSSALPRPERYVFLSLNAVSSVTFLPVLPSASTIYLTAHFHIHSYSSFCSSWWLQLSGESGRPWGRRLGRYSQLGRWGWIFRPSDSQTLWWRGATVTCGALLGSLVVFLEDCIKAYFSSRWKPKPLGTPQSTNVNSWVEELPRIRECTWSSALWCSSATLQKCSSSCANASVWTLLDDRCVCFYITYTVIRTREMCYLCPVISAYSGSSLKNNNYVIV